MASGTIHGFTATSLTTGATEGDISALLHGSDAVEQTPCDASASATPTEPNVCLKADPNTLPNTADSWRIEVAARLERYRTRRKPRNPRYPSLLLPFDAPEGWSRPVPLAACMKIESAEAHLAETGFGETGSATAPARDALDFALEAKEQRAAGERTCAEACQAPAQSAKVIEFPRSAAIPEFHTSDLADPIFDLDRPRIVEAPEILPPPPALGGMLIEPTRQELDDRRADLPSDFRSASVGVRALAAFVDGAILAGALMGFAAIFLRLNPSLNLVHGSLRIPAAGLTMIAVLLWTAYEFLFVVYTGTTPGLRAVGLRLVGFDGSRLNRRQRRWRVLASFLSAFSAGLGCLWCVLDQDGLCWHDRITRTHLQPETSEEAK
ncbi:MAG: RDD family protein [Terriglobales bacterium]